MKQTVVFHRYTYGDCIKFYRGGFDRKSGTGLDPYLRSEHPVNDIVNRFSKPEYPIQRGIVLASSGYSDKLAEVGNFFFGDEFKDKISDIKYNGFIAVDGEWSIVFSHCNELVFYKKDESFVPKKVTKECTPTSEFYKLWNSFGSYEVNKKKKFTIKGYDFGKVDFVVVKSSSHPVGLLPEYRDIVECRLGKEDYNTYFNRLYELPPIDLSKSWDYTPDEKAHIQEEANKRLDEFRKYNEELEKRKRTPGYCERCGKPADYVVDPYDDEINGIINHVWLCPQCYHDAAMDI